MTPTDRIVLTDASIAKGTHTAFHHINWTIKEGQHWVITGKTGVGKTILAESLAQKHRLITGNRHYPFLGEDPSFDVRRNAIQMISFMDTSNLFRSVNAEHYYQQRFNAFDADGHLTVREYLEHGGFDIAQHLDLLELMGISELLDMERIKLSSGQTRKMLLAKVLSRKPQILILDNPYIGLDTDSRRMLNDLLDDRVAHTDLTLIISGHYRDLPRCISHRLHIHNETEVKMGELASFPPSPTLPKSDDSVIDKIRMHYQQSIHAEQFSHIIRFENVNISYSEKQILKDLTWTVKQGEKWRVIGQNGSGKSTVLSLIYADNPQAYANSIYLFDKKVGSGRSIWEVKEKIGFTSPELHAYFDGELTAWQLVLTGLTDTFFLREAPSPKQKELAQLLFDYYELSHHKDTSFQQVSTGTQRLLLLMRALVKAAPVLLLDEPFQGLDAFHIYRSRQLLDHILGPKHTLLFISHFKEEAPDCVESELAL